MKRIENDVMNFIGLPKTKIASHLKSLRKSAPRFLLNVYDKVTHKENNHHTNRSRREIFPEENLITEVDEKNYRKSDIIIAFLNKDHQISEIRHEHGRKLLFDTSKVTENVVLLTAELRIFQNSQLSKFKDSKKKEIIITAYSIVKEDGQKELEIIASVNTTSEYHGWLEMNITDVFEEWLENPKENNGLYISAHEIGRPRHEIKLTDIGYVNDHGDEAYQTFLVGYFKGPVVKKSPKSFYRAKRNLLNFRPPNPLVNEVDEIDGTLGCKRHFLRVAFADLKTYDNLIAPEYYNAYFCEGKCHFPLNAHMNATSHAIVQALAHLYGKAPNPLCAPSKLGPLTVLYFIDEDEIIMKNMKNMVVKSCGCQ